MKTIILAGGLGTRISEETDNKPKPMVQIAGKPILWHIMSIFARQGFNEFVIATGYKGEVISDWVSTLTEPWSIETLDTGQAAQTGGRISQCLDFINENEVFATYGDGLGNINLSKLLDFHVHQGKSATVTAVRPPARFGVLESDNGLVTKFGEKNQADSGWINGGFFVLQRRVSELIYGDNEPFELGALPRLVSQQNLTAYHHGGFWQPMDTLREKQDLELLANRDLPPWLDL
jgi:glucose-1-phosphate cytidylyltransferase